MTRRSAISGPVAAAALGLAFVALSLATRLPFQDRTLFISDSVRYALALERYDMTAGRPHPPGNPVYVALIGGLDRLLDDPVTALAVFSALASGVAFLFAYLLARDLAGETAGWLAAGLLAVSPLFWFFGAVGMPAAGEAALALMVAWMARRARAPVEAGWFWGMTVTLALAFGFRSTFAVLMGPLWLYAAWRHPWRRLVGGAGLIVASAFAWTALVASLSGGWAAYRATSSSFFSEVLIATKILGGGLAKIPVQATDIAISGVLGLGLFLIPLTVGIVGCFTGREPFPEAAPFMAAWALPMGLFHMAYDWAPRFGVLLMAPAVILAAATAVPLAQWLVYRRRSATRPDLPPGPLPRALVLLALAVNLGLFLLPVRIGAWTLPDPYPSGARLLARNHDLSRRDAAIRAAHDPDSTLILAYDHVFHAAYFLPEYRVVGLFPLFSEAADAWVPSARGRVFSFEPGSTALPAVDPLPLPADIRTVVIYDDSYLDLWPEAALPLTPMPYDVERALQVATLPAGAGCLDFGYRQLAYLDGDAPECRAPAADRGEP
jgi:hypothetical protein